MDVYGHWFVREIFVSVKAVENEKDNVDNLMFSMFFTL